jgi:hypothetical protein
MVAAACALRRARVEVPARPREAREKTVDVRIGTS